MNHHGQIRRKVYFFSKKLHLMEFLSLWFMELKMTMVINHQHMCKFAGISKQDKDLFSVGVCHWW
jgi:hypothetical protein